MLDAAVWRERIDRGSEALDKLEMVGMDPSVIFGKDIDYSLGG